MEKILEEISICCQARSAGYPAGKEIGRVSVLEAHVFVIIHGDPGAGFGLQKGDRVKG
jgi:hypothetical protein